MTDTANTTTQAPKFVIVRNGVSKALEEQVFGKKSDNAGKKFYAPVITLETFDTDINWLGKDQAIGALNKNLRLISADLFLSNIERNGGTLNEEEFKQEMAELTASRVSLADIEQQLEDLYAMQDSLIQDDNFGATVGDSDEKTPEAIAIEQKMVALNKQIKPLKVKKQAIETEYAARAAKRKAKEQSAPAVVVPGEAVPA